jgi:hypothetical protein
MLMAAPEARQVMLVTDAVGGVWRYSLELASQFAVLCIRVVLAVMGPRPDEDQVREIIGIPNLQLIITGLPLDWLADRAGELRNAAHELALLAAELQVDTIHLHTPALVGDAIWPCPVVAVAHSCVGTWWRAVRDGTLPPDMAWRVGDPDRSAAGPSRCFATHAPDARHGADLRWWRPRRAGLYRSGRGNACQSTMRLTLRRTIQFRAIRHWQLTCLSSPIGCRTARHAPMRFS